MKRAFVCALGVMAISSVALAGNATGTLWLHSPQAVDGVITLYPSETAIVHIMMSYTYDSATAHTMYGMDAGLMTDGDLSVDSDYLSAAGFNTQAPIGTNNPFPLHFAFRVDNPDLDYYFLSWASDGQQMSNDSGLDAQPSPGTSYIMDEIIIHCDGEGVSTIDFNDEYSLEGLPSFFDSYKTAAGTWKSDERTFGFAGEGLTVVNLPEPASLALLALGGLVLIRRR